MANIKATYKRYTGSQWDVIHFETTTAQVLRVLSSDATNYPNSDQFVTGAILDALKNPNDQTFSGFLKLDSAGNVIIPDGKLLRFYRGIGDDQVSFGIDLINGQFGISTPANLSLYGGSGVTIGALTNGVKIPDLRTNSVNSDGNNAISVKQNGSEIIQITSGGVDVASGKKITQAAAPTGNDDLTNKRYVDLVAGYGMNPLVAARAATTANITLTTDAAAGKVIDGVTLVAGDRLLVKDQTTKSQNGVYIVKASGTPDRATDANTPSNLTGALIAVTEGTTNKRCIFYQTDEVSTVGTSNQTWILFANTADYYTAGTGLTLSGNQFTISTGGVGASQLATDAVTQTKIADGAVIAAKLADNSVLTAKILDGAVTPAKLSATFNVTDAGGTIPGSAISNNASLPNIIDYFAKQFINITGKTNWRTGPATTLEAVNTSITSINSSISTINTNLSKKQNSISYGTTAPTSPSAGDIWIDIS